MPESTPVHRTCHSLSFQLISRAVSAIAFCLAIAFVSLYWAIGKVIDNEMDDDLHEDILEFRAVFSQGGDRAVLDEMIRETQGGESRSVFLKLLDANNKVIHATDMDYWSDVGTDSQEVRRQAEDFKAESSLYSVEPQRQEAGARIITGRIGLNRVLQIGESMDARDDIMELLIGAIALVFLAALPLAALLGWLATRSAAAGIKSVSDAARQIQNGNLQSRAVVGNQSNEVNILADSFNSMADRVNSLINDMREMTDNIAHDLRSPLGRIRAIAESAITGPQSSHNYRIAAEKSISECDWLIKLINASLDVAETEAGVARLNIESVDLAALADEACEVFDAVAEEKNIELLKQIDPDHVIQGDRQSLLRMLLNLLDNAVKYTPANGRVRVAVTADAGGQYLEVADNGTGIPDSEKSRVFDRFYRCDQSRTDEGCGLGLSFAQAVAKMHGGEIRLSADPLYRTVFRVSFNTPSTLG